MLPFARLALLSIVLGACGDDATPSSDAGRDAGRVDSGGAETDSGTDSGAIDAGSDAGTADAGSDAGVVCPCFDEAFLDEIEALGGDRTCVVDMMAGGTTQTALVMVVPDERVVAEAPIAMGGERLCGAGCLPLMMGGACGRAREFSQVRDLSESAHGVCRDLIAAHCR
jgi:hypothetical protein